MFAPRTVCLRCASRASSTAAHNLNHGAWFTSVAGQSESTASPQQGHRRQTRRHFTPRGSQSGPLKPAEEAAVALFNDVVGAKHATTAVPSSHLHLWEVTSAVQALVHKDVGAVEKLESFRADILPHITDSASHLPKHLNVNVRNLFASIYQDMIDTGQLARGIELCEAFKTLGITSYNYNNGLVMNICHALLSGADSTVSRADVFNELLAMWKYISQLGRKLKPGERSKLIVPEARDVVHDIKAGRTGHTVRKDLTTRIFAAVLLHLPFTGAKQLMPGLFATLAVLSDARLAPQAAREELAPLLNLVGIALDRVRMPDDYISSLYATDLSFPPAKVAQIQSYVAEQWPQVLAMLSPEVEWRSKLGPVATPEGNTSKKLATFHRHLRLANRVRDVGGISSVWVEFKSYVRKSSTAMQQLRDDPELLDYWVFVWCGARRPNRLHETLEIMAEIGVQPSVKTYTSMMHGWKNCKDAEKIEALWNQLVHSGIHLDHIIWTERISGLIEGGKPQLGLRALGEMMENWKAAYQTDPETTVARPQIEVINAVISGIVKLDPKAAQEVLDWASREGIEPNIRTYNILLQQVLRRSSPFEVQSLLKSIKDHGLHPDAATFTILLEEVIGTMQDTSSAELVASVLDIFDDIKAAGLKANHETYGKMLYAVAGLRNSDAAIEAIQSRMRADNFSVTPQMITILVERASSRSPPDIAAIEALIQQHKLTSVTQGDQTLWERIMSAFAWGGNIERALEIFRELEQAGRPVTSLSCLKDLLHALVKAQKWEDAQHVVASVVRYKEASREDPDSRYWKHHFWYLARQHGLWTPGRA
ncbi:hypothetical protein S7711_04581 [Stachybotrys chartarum IBT 7711]|uniref:Pentacotripeptide-repeat region of PRORP domain-containing protein n=1 Tax=Stachybotrys chartarum (strain CBS 109288 / IBT 7711) TaxID=1280523 RepID=A0A084APV1_STACB|nr:hypothetical protein S7711_04581 [Stachybotrys chartarum IBT 7711]KFA52825.1 hypothetical protein S40293_00920 [Stachybotrys chartarum IBT 40293]KFA75322.1 hypothetical protein S40288_00258 [Stachybotrys chartarum IBT 40288]